MQETYGKLSVSFDANQDQGDPQVKFVPRSDAFVSTGEGHGSLQFSTATYGATETDGPRYHHRNPHRWQRWAGDG